MMNSKLYLNLIVIFVFVFSPSAEAQSSWENSKKSPQMREQNKLLVQNVEGDTSKVPNTNVSQNSELSVNNYSSEPKGQTNFLINPFKDNWFISFGSGAQILRGEDDRKGSLINAITYAPALSIGKYFSPVWGVRFNFTGGSLHGYNDGFSGHYRKWIANSEYYNGQGYAGTPGYPAQTGSNFSTWDPQWNYLGFELGKDIFQTTDGDYYWGDGTKCQLYMQHIRYVAVNTSLLVDVVNLFGGYNPYRKFDLTMMGGPTLFHTFSYLGNDFQNGIGLNGGIQAKFKLGSRWEVYAEALANIYSEGFDGHIGSEVTNDFVLQTTAGLTYKFGRSNWLKCDNTDYELIERLNNEINDLKNRPCNPVAEPMKPDFSPMVSYIEPVEEVIKKREISGEAYVVFQVGKSILLPNLSNNVNELEKITKSIDYVKDESDVVVDGISISGHASPEGNEQTNLKLAQERAEALKEHIKILYKLDNQIFSVNTNGENWEGLANILEETNLTEREKADIGNIIKFTDNIATRKNKIKTYEGGKPYKYLLSEIYPKLRRTDYSINYSVPHFSIARGKELIKTKPAMLSLNEMYLVANSYEKGSPDFVKCIETALSLYPNDPIANINAAAAAIQHKEYLRAENYLEKVKTNPLAYCNLGALYMATGKYEDAKKYLEMAKDNGDKSAKENLIELDELLDELEKYKLEKAKYENDLQMYKKTEKRETRNKNTSSTR